MYAFWGHISMLPKIAEKLRPIAEQIVERFNAKIRPLDTSRFHEEVKSFLSIYNRSLTNTWGFVPMSDAEVEHVAKGMQQLLVPELAVFVEVDGRLAGACLGLLDYNPRIKEIGGRLFPFGFIHLLRNKKAIKKMRLISTNVLPEYQMQGLGLVLMHGIVPKAIEWGMEEAEFSWVLESNSLSRGALTKGGAKITKTYRVYDLDFNEAEVAGRRQAVRRAAVKGRLEIRPVVSRRDLNTFLKTPWGSTPTIRSGCRSCCWIRRNSSIPAYIPSTCTGPLRSSLPTATGCRRGGSSSATIPATTKSRRPTRAASACSNRPTTRKWPRPC